MKNNRRSVVYMLAVVMLISALFAAACSNNETANAELTPAPRYDEDAYSENPESFGDSADAEVLGRVAYILSDNVLYGALEYKNTGDCPITVSAAEFVFSVDGDELRETAAQPSYEYCVVYPGETGYLAAWIELGSEAAYENAELTGAELTYEKAAPERRSMAVTDCMIAQNYPGFATVTGTVEYSGTDECPLNIVYLGFYNSDDELLGVWCFTDDTAILPDQPAKFSTHMRNLTIEGLAQNTARIEAAAFGIG